jgi:hypothetical protein
MNLHKHPAGAYIPVPTAQDTTDGFTIATGKPSACARHTSCSERYLLIAYWLLPLLGTHLHDSSRLGALFQAAQAMQYC